MNGAIRIEEIDLYATERCNLKCDFCSVEANRRLSSELSLDKIVEVIAAAKDYGLEHLHLTGGEPTLRDDLEDIIKYADSRDINVRLITNGTILSIERLTALCENGLKSIMISLDGLEAYHDRFRGKGSYQKVMELLKGALAIPDLTVRINSVAWMDNLNDIFELTTILDRFGVEIYSIFLGSPLGYAKDLKSKVLDYEAYKAFSNQEKKLIHEKSINMKVAIEKGFLFEKEEKYDRAKLKGRGIGCYKMNEGSDYFIIRGDGDMYPCVFFANEGDPIGNIMKESFNEIVESFHKNVFYYNIGQVPTECNNCINADICRGGCRGYAKIYNNDWSLKDPRCPGKNSKYFPTCPIMKINLNTGVVGGSSEQVVGTSHHQSN